MDGGRGQVNIAQQVLDELHLNIPVCGMVKDDNHRTRGLYFHNVELPIDRNSEAFKLITRVQDEAHRFAIEYHRSLRSKDQVKSVLDGIPGVGPARRKALMKAFRPFTRSGRRRRSRSACRRTSRCTWRKKFMNFPQTGRVTLPWAWNCGKIKRSIACL